MNYLKNFSYLLLFVLLAMVPLLTNSYTQYIFNLITVYVIVSIAFNLTLGYAGQFSFANGALFGFGAYSCGLLMAHLHLSFWIAMPLAGIMTAILGAILGISALRLKVYALAIVTIAFTLLMEYIYKHGGWLTFGVGGFSMPSPTIFGHAFSTDKEKYYIVLPLAMAIFIMTRNILRTKFGRAFVTIKESELIAQAFAIDVRYFKIVVFLLSSFIVGIGGSLFVMLIGFVAPESFGLTEMMFQLLLVVVGGLGSMTGCVLGPLLLTSLPEIFRQYRGFEEILFGSLLIICIVLMPSGIYGMLVKYISACREKLHG
jgi:branched-chain amino acid transport system permease protein